MVNLGDIAIEFIPTGEFRVQNNGTKECLSVAPKSEPGSSVVLGSCEGQLSQWLFTLTGAIMVGHVS